MIQLKGIEKYHRSGLKKHYILKNINLSIQEGEFVTIMGPSGAGKSTLLHILGMLESASGGSYQFFDYEISKMNERKKNEAVSRNATNYNYRTLPDGTYRRIEPRPLPRRRSSGRSRPSTSAGVGGWRIACSGGKAGW